MNEFIKMKKVALLIIVIIGFSVLNAQNLVPNASFENAWTCPSYFYTEAESDIIPMWHNPSRGTPDYFNRCSDSIVSVPLNFAGTLEAHDGNGYMGLILRETFEPELRRDGVSREYIQVKIASALKAGHLYCFTMQYALSSRSPFAVDALGVAITKTKISSRDARQIIQMPQITNIPGHFMQNKTGWAELCGIYRARGNEQYLTIGNFLNDDKTSFIPMNDADADSNFVYAYYYIDNVKLIEIEDEFQCGCQDDFSVGSDYLSEKYDRKTGFNTRKPDNSDNNGNLADNRNGGNTTLINGNAVDNGNNPSGNNGNNAENAGDSDKNYSNIGNNSDENKGTDVSGNYTAGNSNENLSDNTKDLDNFDIASAGIGDAFRMSRIYFEFNSAELLDPSFDQMNKLLVLLKENPRLRIEIRGHTDNVGTKQYNRKLSIARAAAVYNYLIANGVDKSRMKYRGFGNDVPVATNDTEEGRQLNRRVEILIVEL